MKHRNQIVLSGDIEEKEKGLSLKPATFKAAPPKPASLVSSVGEGGTPAVNSTPSRRKRRRRRW